MCCLGIFIIGAPVFFSTVWGWIKRWFDPITVSKIFVLSSHEVLPTLTAFVDPKNIPKRYGGELDFNFGDQPLADPAWEGIVRWENGYSSFPSGPMVWREIEDGARLECIGIGRIQGKERQERICTIPKTWSPPVAKEEKEMEAQVNGVVVEAPKATVDSEGADTAPVSAGNDAEAKTVEAEAKEDATSFLKLTQTPAPPAGPEVNPMDETKPAEKEDDQPVTATGEAMEKLTVSDAIAGKEATSEVTEKMGSEGVSAAVPSTVA
jgi:hypothetical protein